VSRRGEARRMTWQLARACTNQCPLDRTSAVVHNSETCRLQHVRDLVACWQWNWCTMTHLDIHHAAAFSSQLSLLRVHLVLPIVLSVTTVLPVVSVYWIACSASHSATGPINDCSVCDILAFKTKRFATSDNITCSLSSLFRLLEGYL